MTAAAVVGALLVAAGGAAGAVVRHLLVTTASTHGPGARAAAVATCNLVGAVVLAGIVAVDAGGRWWLATVVGAGFTGALTTFSTWMVDAAVSLESGDRAPAVVVLADLVGQLVVGVGLAWVVLRLL